MTSVPRSMILSDEMDETDEPVAGTMNDGATNECLDLELLDLECNIDECCDGIL